MRTLITTKLNLIHTTENICRCGHVFAENFDRLEVSLIIFKIRKLFPDSTSASLLSPMFTHYVADANL
ncbi:Uncharacterised protein g2387 [Pycnogonum litorale]